nr:hypothetical protein [Tanacetum cinerariifolium]
MTKPYSSYHFVANCFNVGHLKMEVKVVHDKKFNYGTIYILRGTRTRILIIEEALQDTKPKIDDKYSFELNGQFLKELRDNTFSGLDHADANEHIEKVLKIVDLFHNHNITQD